MDTKLDLDFESFSKLTHEEIYSDLQKIKSNICWMENQINLTKDQWEMFYTIKNSLKHLLGVR